MAVYTALLKPGDKMMGLNLTHGGHLTHGYFTPTRRVSASSIYWNSSQYEADLDTGLIDYEGLEKKAKDEKPQLIISGFSAYTRDLDYERVKKICDSVGALHLADVSHISGLIATQQLRDPFPHSDVVTSTTHKSLRGPRSGMIFARKKLMPQINEALEKVVQGASFRNNIAALAT